MITRHQISSFHSQKFSFNSQNLAYKLEHQNDLALTGYWHHFFDEDACNLAEKSWWLGLVGGQVVFSGQQPLSIDYLLEIIERYIFRVRSEPVQSTVLGLKEDLHLDDCDRPLEPLPVFLSRLYELKIIQPEEVRQALRLKVLQDLDQMLFSHSGQAQFKPETDLSIAGLTPGFEISEILAESRRRQLIWEQIKRVIPNLDSKLFIHEKAIRESDITDRQKKYLRALISHGETLNSITVALAQDTLEIARGVAKLAEQGLIEVELPPRKAASEVLIVDDSPVMLKQFKQLVSSWGYQVRSHDDPVTAVEIMLETQPAIVFIDINMPNISGFDLLKQIRRYPQIATTPLIMLTAERTLSNNWRSQWSGCQFLSKPLTTEEIPKFETELRGILKLAVPIKKEKF
ncbi:response regulator [Nodosilinea sp. E11]|uniref:response regulator n=1 Tax=Nodosilinea sp. E11 TaxID=3037479 RepID=UPI002934891A|nr:response regulator [Nodosilinea sp. E11]WOD39650.1 response regulator [Nodosilinea sp. E11]